MTNASDHSVFVYMYRDAANYKVGGQLLLRGTYAETSHTAIRQQCEVWDHFVAEQVGIPTLYEALYRFSGGPTIDDIAFHEFEHLRPASREDVASLATWGSLDGLVANFCAVKFWDCTLSPHCG